MFPWDGKRQKAGISKEARVDILQVLFLSSGSDRSLLICDVCSSHNASIISDDRPQCWPRPGTPVSPARETHGCLWICRGEVRVSCASDHVLKCILASFSA